MAMQNFDWYAQRLDLARWEDETPGQKSGFFACPVHGGSDSLHVTEKNGKALLKCFACAATAMDITAALEGGSESTPERQATALSVRRKKATRPIIPSNGSQTPASGLAWMAARCAMTLDELKALELPLSETKGSLVFEFPDTGARKLRTVTDAKKKEFHWDGDESPPLWPMPTSPAGEIVIAEGEADAICLRHSGLQAYSVTKGAGAAVPDPAWDALRLAGVESVLLVYDMDEAGRRGREQAAIAARRAGLRARESRVVGIQPLAGEKDARSVALRQGYPLALEDDGDEDEAVVLTDVDAVPPAPLLIGMLHPNEHTILFGDGGVGKGVLAAWLISRLSNEGYRILIVDYEQHAKFEWRPRVEAFGGDLDAVLIVQPMRPIWDIASWIRGQADRNNATYVVVDSVAYACVGDEPEKSVTATKYSLAVAAIGYPVLSLAHVPKDSPDPSHPFGSTFWSNGARVTISMSRQKQEDPESPRIVRNAKTNQRAPFRTVAIDWTWLNNVRPGIRVAGQDFTTLKFTNAYTRASDAIRDAAAMLGRTPTVEEVFQQTGYQTTDGNIRAVVSRDKQVVVLRGRHATRDADTQEPGSLEESPSEVDDKSSGKDQK